MCFGTHAPSHRRINKNKDKMWPRLYLIRYRSRPATCTFTHTQTQWMQHTVRSFVSGPLTGSATPKTHSSEEEDAEFKKIEQRWREVMIQHMCVTGVIGRCRRLWLQKEIYLMRNAKQLCLQSIFVCDDEQTHPRSFHRFYDNFFSACHFYFLLLLLLLLLLLRFSFFAGCIRSRLYKNLCLAGVHVQFLFPSQTDHDT